VLDRNPSSQTPSLQMAVAKDTQVTLGAEDAIVLVAED
jgi:hypothetical protein